jgi:hypothetical protein
MHPDTFVVTVSLGCIHDDVRSEPGSWIVVGMIPIFDKKKATRKPGGPGSGSPLSTPLFYINTWAMVWPNDYPAVAT